MLVNIGDWAIKQKQVTYSVSSWQPSSWQTKNHSDKISLFLEDTFGSDPFVNQMFHPLNHEDRILLFLEGMAGSEKSPWLFLSTVYYQVY